MNVLEMTVDPAWSDGVRYIAAIPVFMVVVAGVQELVVRFLGRGDGS